MNSWSEQWIFWFIIFLDIVFPQSVVYGTLNLLTEGKMGIRNSMEKRKHAVKAYSGEEREGRDCRRTLRPADMIVPSKNLMPICWIIRVHAGRRDLPLSSLTKQLKKILEEAGKLASFPDPTLFSISTQCLVADWKSLFSGVKHIIFY